jgi:arylsulfatase A-like enzyme
LRWPGLSPRTLNALCYQVDVAATIVELLGGRVPAVWDGVSLAEAIRTGRDEARSELVITQGAWTCQRGVRWDDYMAIRTLHDGYHAYDDWMVFDVVRDPHEQHNLAHVRPALVRDAENKLAAWHSDVMQRSTTGVDPLDTVLAEGGPSHTRGKLPAYVERLRSTGRSDWAERLMRAHPHELGP